MRLSLWPNPERPIGEVLELAEWGEQCGWDGIYLADHFMPNDPSGKVMGGPSLDCLAALGAVAARVTRMRVGSLVLGNLYRHPAVVAHWAATMGTIAEGGFVLGVGAGWQVNEHVAFGLELGTIRDRLNRFEEAVVVIRSMLNEERTTFVGDHYQIRDAPCEPQPNHRIPLLIGGKGEQRTMRIAARLADEWNAWCTPEELAHKSAVLNRHCADLGRDPADICRSTQALLWPAEYAEGRTVPESLALRPRLEGSWAAIAGQVQAYAAAGTDELIVPDWLFTSVEAARHYLGEFLTVAAEARA